MPTKTPTTFSVAGTLSLSGRRADAYRMTIARHRALELVLADQIRQAVRETLGGDVALTLTACGPDLDAAPRLPEVTR